MSDLFYRTVRFLGRHAFWVSSTPVVIGREHIPETGACLIAANHTSAYDIPLLMRHVSRPVDFVSIIEVFQKPFLGWLYGNMNAFPLDRHRPDVLAIRTIVDRIRSGRIVALFPEGGFRRGENSVLHHRTLRPGFGRLVRMARVPIIPTVIINSAAYSQPRSWLPLFRTRYGVAFAAPISPDLPPEEIESALIDSLVKLYHQTAALLPEGARNL